MEDNLPVPLIDFGICIPGRLVTARDVVDNPKFGDPVHIEILRRLRLADRLAEIRIRHGKYPPVPEGCTSEEALQDEIERWLWLEAGYE